MGLYHYAKCAIKYKLNVNIRRTRENTFYTLRIFPPLFIHDDDTPHLHAAYTILNVLASYTAPYKKREAMIYKTHSCYHNHVLHSPFVFHFDT